MGTQITTELLETIFDRVQQFCIVRFDSKPNSIMLEEGSLTAIWEDYLCGSIETTYECISVDNLTEDLQLLAEKRKEQEEVERKELLAKMEKEKIIDEKRKKEERKQQYFRLKKEFENL